MCSSLFPVGIFCHSNLHLNSTLCKCSPKTAEVSILAPVYELCQELKWDWRTLSFSKGAVLTVWSLIAKIRGSVGEEG